MCSLEGLGFKGLRLRSVLEDFLVPLSSIRGCDGKVLMLQGCCNAG